MSDSSFGAGFGPGSGPPQSPDAADPSGAPSASPRFGGSSHLEAGLYVVATPIGNLRDITLRALDVLAGADLLYAEDSRVSVKLLNAYGIKARLHSYHEHNAESARAEILDALAAGARVALLSDAGTPLISDPGFKLTRAAIAAGHKVIPIPGASAPLAALVASGLASDRFVFAGFPPTKAGARAEFFAELAGVRATLIFFETGPRLGESLAAMAQAFGARDAAVARELTKLHEEVRRGSLTALAQAYGDAPPRGEIVVLVGPPGDAPAPDATTLDAELRAALARASVKEAAAEVAARHGLPRRDLYARALALKDAP